MDLHPRIASTVGSLFSQGLYDLAAFEAMKQVEIRVRDLSKASAGDIGVPLIRQAFKPDGGPLADPKEEKGEQDATSSLFAGAIGTFKNPTSRRDVEYDDPTEASEFARELPSKGMVAVRPDGPAPSNPWRTNRGVE